MDERTRRFAHAHWGALDAAMTRTFSRDQVDWCRAAFRSSVTDIAAKYVKRLLTGDDAASSGIETAGRELADALTSEWESAQGSDPDVGREDHRPDGPTRLGDRRERRTRGARTAAPALRSPVES